MEDKFEKARQIAKELIAANKRWLEVDGRELSRFEMKAIAGIEEIPEELCENWDSEPLIKGFNDMSFYDENHVLFDPEDVTELLKQAETDADAYQVCLELIVLCLREDTLIDCFHSFLLNHLREDGKRPVRKGPSVHTNRPRNILITRTVIKVSKNTGIPYSRNDGGDPLSACDIVAEQLNMTYEAVKRIWFINRHYPYLWKKETYTTYFDDGLVID